MTMTFEERDPVGCMVDEVRAVQFLGRYGPVVEYFDETYRNQIMDLFHTGQVALRSYFFEQDGKIQAIPQHEFHAKYQAV